MHAAPALPRMHVRSALELRQAVRRASAGLLRLDASGLDRVLRLDTTQGLIEVQASASWSALAGCLPSCGGAIARGWEASFCDARSIGASLDTNAPGPDGSPLISHIEAIALVTADGELRRVSRRRGAELFALAVGGQGLFGVTYSVTFRLESIARAALAASPATGHEATPPAHPEKLLALLLPPERLERFTDDARRRCSEWRLAMRIRQVRELLADRESFLSWAKRDYTALTLAIEAPPALAGCVRATQLRRELLEAAIGHGGSFPIARTPDATRDHLAACYPELAGFIAEKRRYDPGERLANDWYRHHRSLLGREACEVRWSR